MATSQSKRKRDHRPRRPTATCETSDCPICHGRLRSCVALVPCGHAFCKRCVQEWLKRSSSCPSCRTDVLNPRWVRVRIVDELLELFPPGEGADLPSAVSEATGDVVHPGSCGNCHAVLRASGGEACGVCGMDLGLCRRCAAATLMQCEECESWICSSSCTSRPCVYCRISHVCANCYNSPLRRCPRPEC